MGYWSRAECRQAPCFLGAGGGATASAAVNPTLTVEVARTGVVTSDFDTISCPPACSTTAFKTGTTVTLTASAAPGWVFSGWEGPCVGASLTCTFTILKDTTATATFVETMHKLGVDVSGQAASRARRPASPARPTAARRSRARLR